MGITDINSHIRAASFLVSVSHHGKLDFTEKDIEAQSEIAERRGAKDDRYRVRKALLDGDKTGLATVKSVVSQVQKLYREYMTRPYEHGKRMLPVRYIKSAVITFEEYVSSKGAIKYRLVFPRLVFKPAGMSLDDFEKQIGEKPTTTWWLFQQGMSEGSMIYDRAVHKFLGNYDQAIVDAENDLGSGFNAAQYKSAAELREEYKLEFFKEIPTTEDARKLEEIFGLSEIQKMMEEQERQRELKMQEGNSDVLNCFVKPLTHFVESLQRRIDFDPDKDTGRAPSIAGSVIDNLKNGVIAARLKNVSDDASLDVLCNKIDTWVECYDTKALKNDALTRDIAKDEAEQMMEDVEALTNSMQGIL